MGGQREQRAVACLGFTQCCCVERSQSGAEIVLMVKAFFYSSKALLFLKQLRLDCFIDEVCLV